jgi:hypothetical protein
MQKKKIINALSLTFLSLETAIRLVFQIHGILSQSTPPMTTKSSSADIQNHEEQ